MTNEEYQKAIPHHCTVITADEHIEFFLLCWGISQGFVQSKVDYCRTCELKVMAKRKEKNANRQMKRLLDGTLKKHEAW